MRGFRNGTLTLTALLVWGTSALPAEKVVPENGALQVALLRQRSIRETLKLTDDEAKKIHEFTHQQWRKAHEIDKLPDEQQEQKFAELSRENDRFIDATLEPDQRRRLDQITLQVAGLLWVTNPKIAQAIGLTDEQKTKLRAHQQEAQKEMQEIIHAKTRRGQREKLQELRATSRKRLLEVLTDAQEERWKEMSGEPFEGEVIIEIIEVEPR